MHHRLHLKQLVILAYSQFAYFVSSLFIFNSVPRSPNSFFRNPVRLVPIQSRSSHSAGKTLPWFVVLVLTVTGVWSWFVLFVFVRLFGLVGGLSGPCTSGRV